MQWKSRYWAPFSSILEVTGEKHTQNPQRRKEGAMNIRVLKVAEEGGNIWAWPAFQNMVWI